MFPAGTKPEPKSRFIQYHTGYCQNQDPKICSNIRILEKHFSNDRNIAQNRNLFDTELVFKGDLLYIADYACHKNCESGSKHIDCRSADTLIGFHINRCVGMNQRYYHTCCR